MIRRVGDFLAWLGGADEGVLKQVPSERIRFVQMAGVLLTTASIAVLSMAFALHDGVKAPWAAAIAIGILWGIIIINLDRFLVLSMGSTRERGRLLAMAAPRLMMAMLLAVVISTPLVLRIFSSDINARVYTMQLERSKQQRALEASSKEQLDANKLQQQISADQAVLNGNYSGKVTSPQLQAAQTKVTGLQSLVATDQHAANVAYKAWVCELYGHRCYGASGVPGDGNLAQIKQHQYQQAQATLNSAKRQLKAAKAAESAVANAVSKNKASDLAQAQQRARAALPGLRKQLAQLNAFIRGEEAHGTQLNNGATGILTQIEALYSIGAQDPALGLAHLAVFLLFFMIEMLPVTVKVLLNFGPLSAYEIVAKLKEDELIDKARTLRNEARRIEESKSQTRIDIEDHMRSKEVVLGRQANDHVAAEMTKILDVALHDWSTRVQARLSGHGQPQPALGGVVPAQGQPGNGPAAAGSATGTTAPGIAAGPAATGPPAAGTAATSVAAAGAAAIGAGGAGVSGTGATPSVNGTGPAGAGQSSSFILPDSDNL